MLELGIRPFEIELSLLKLTDVRGRDIIPSHLHRSFDLGIQVDDLFGKVILVPGKKPLSRHDLRHRVVELGYAITHVTDRLLEYQFRILDPVQGCTRTRPKHSS
jgi:hypothetical protein